MVCSRTLNHAVRESAGRTDQDSPAWFGAGDASVPRDCAAIGRLEKGGIGAKSIHFSPHD